MLFIIDPLGKMNTSLYKLELCAISEFPHHTTMSATSLQQVLHHYSEHVARLSIMGLQCCLILEDVALVNILKVSHFLFAYLFSTFQYENSTTTTRSPEIYLILFK